MRAGLSTRLSCLLLVLTLAGSSAAYAAAGNFQFVAGEVKVLDRTGVERLVKKGESVDEGDTIVTAPSASAQIRMVDGGFIAVRPDSHMKFETYTFNGKQDGSERSIISLIKGGFRAITGLIGKLNKDNYQIKTPGATIGIRGTDHEPMYIPQPLPGTVALGVPGTYDRVNRGAAFIKTDLGIVHINPNQVGFAAGMNVVPQLLPKIPDFYKPAPERTGSVEEGKTRKEQPDALKVTESKQRPEEYGGDGGLRPVGKGGAIRDGRTPPKDASTKEVLRTPSARDTARVAPASLAKTLSPDTSGTILLDPIRSSTTLVAPTTSTTKLIAPTTTTLIDPIRSTTTLVAPTISTTKLIAPTTSTTTLIDPIRSTTTLVAPTISTTTLISPITTTKTFIAPISSTTTLIAPTTTTTTTTRTLIAPTTSTTTLIAPTTTLVPLK